MDIAHFPKLQWKKLLLLISLGLVGNIFGVSLFFGVGIVFGSIASLIILRIYGPICGVVSALIIHSYALILWEHPYAYIIFISETLFLSFFLRKNRMNRNLLFWDGLFWFSIGIPLTWIFYHYVIGMGTTFSLVIVLKHCVNGLFNALVAGLLLEFSPIKKWFSFGQASHSLQRNIFYLLVSFILFPTLFFILYEGYKEVQRVRQEMAISLIDITQNIQEELNNWYYQHLTPLRKLAVQQTYNPVPLEQLNQNLELLTQSFPQFTMMYIAEPNGTAYAFYPLTNEQGESLIGLNYSDRDYYRVLKNTLEPVVSDVIIAKGKPYPIVALGMPIIQDHHFHGFIGAALSLDSVRNLILDKLDKPGYTVTIMDSKNQVITTNEPRKRTMDMYGSLPHSTVDELKQHSLTSNRSIQIWQPSDPSIPPMLKWEKSYYWKHTHLGSSLPWSIIVKGSVAPYQLQVYNLYIKILTICLFILILTQPLSLLLSRWIVSPIERLSRITSNLSVDAITHKQQEEAWPRTSIREIQILIQNFQLMSEKLKDMFYKIQQSNEHLEYLAHHDELTGLSNRYHFKEKFQLLVDSKKENTLIAILFIDLDRFKFINDSIGHDIGDLLLQQMAKRMVWQCGEKDVIARYGGDEFLIMLPEVIHMEEVESVAQSILDQIQKPFHLEGHEFVVTGSMGISIYPYDGQDIKTLIKHADTAMYAAKDSGKNQYQFFSSNMNESILYKMELEKELRKAIEENQFELLYQPQFYIHNGKISGVEALLRWNHPNMGVISPADFIPLAEETGLIIPIGEWVMREACRQRKKWQTDLRIAVNVSMKQFLHEDFIHNLRNILRETGMDPEELKLEITESIAMKHPDYVIEKLKELKRVGVQLALDDFGTGYSSLNYLKEFPVDYLKIDRTFIRDIETSSAQSSIIRSIIHVAHNLNLSIIAEGVETPQQLEFLKDNLCNEAQGFLFAKPLKASEIENRLFLSEQRV
ncbi:EAL domain-containing protein [Ammoniphilus sp. CFH 90114]|uniref:bifunctional diguanylate cyclase/phosphodiesterase n=1 Tax=Ammoniphilus sp. CFH 90114 TaxID=2493665 RepID=UPI00100F5D63|nr:EAL domain-containing protein [Ammoniphilus sp. CFH 90114]RXT15323.1 EAL domain-containing protein [Ammoniphilus sp. CFH 90114]